MLQALVLDGLSFDPFPFQQDGLAAPEVDIGGREVIQALVVAPVVVVLDEGADLGFEITGQIIEFSSRIRFLRVWRQRSILPWVWGW